MEVNYEFCEKIRKDHVLMDLTILSTNNREFSPEHDPST
jgi:hypothetical protein